MKCIVILLVLICQAFAYDPPPGIPDPAWGAIHPIDTTAPANPASWPSAAETGYYYIDNTSGAATDTSNTYGYPNKPRLTIPTTLAAGSYIEIHGGPYTGSQLIMTLSGTEANPCWIKGVGLPVIQRETIIKGSYVFIDGLKWDTNAKTLGLRTHSASNLHHCVVRNCVFDGPGTVGSGSSINIYGATGNRFHDIVIYNNTITEFGKFDNAVENDYHGVKPATDVDDCWILGNTIHHMGGDSVQVGEASIADTARCDGVYIGGNTFYTNLENAIDIKEAYNVVCSQNLCYNFPVASTLGGVAIVIHNSPDNVWMIFNTVHTAGTGIQTTGSTNTWFVGNVIYDIAHTSGDAWNPDNGYSDGAAMHMRGSSGGCVDNTVARCDTGIQLTTGSTSYRIHGNVFADMNEATGYILRTADSGVSGATVADYNLSEDYRVSWSGVTYTSPASFAAATTSGDHDLSGDPLFVSAASDDFRILTGSPAKDVSVEGPVGATAYDAFFTVFSVSIEKDALSNSRPANSIWDMGAHEFGAGGGGGGGGISATVTDLNLGTLTVGP